MAGLVIDIKQLRKRRQPQPAPGEVAALATDSEVSESDSVAGTTPTEPVTPAAIRQTDNSRQSALEAAIDRLSEKNPALQLLMDTMELDAIAITSPPGHARLWDMSGEILKPGETSNRAELIRRIQTTAGVPVERAELGFKMMLDSHAIEPTGSPDHYYLGGSRPF